MTPRAMRRTNAPRKHVLVIDDAVSVRVLIREVLEEAGYRTTVADTVVDVDAVKQHAPDLVVLDPIVGAGDRGWQLVRGLRADPATCDLPVVVCTGAARRVREETAHLAQGPTGLVLKPFAIDDLLEEVTALLSRRPPAAA